MGTHTSKRRIVVSVVLGVLLVGGAYFSTYGNNGASATNTNDVLKSLANKDSNADGMPDWIEVLYGLDPKNLHAFSPDVTNAEAIRQGLVKLTAPAVPKQVDTDATTTDDGIPQAAPGSFTEQFARDFFMKFMEARGNSTSPLSEADQNTLVKGFISSFQDNAQQFFTSRFSFTSLSIHTDQTAVGYVSEVERLLNQPGTGLDTGDPLPLIQRTIENGDEDARHKLSLLGAELANLATELAHISTPPRLADAHLKLVQAFDRIGLAEISLARANEDPMIAMAAVSVLQEAPFDAQGALGIIVESVTREGGTPDTPDKPGFMLRSILSQDK